jgi:hypothetical protein
MAPYIHHGAGPIGREMESILVTLGRGYGAVFGEASQDLWKFLIDKAEAEAYGKTKTIPQGQGIKAYGVVYRWFTGVSGIGPAEQARRSMHPEPPTREEELAEHVEMWQDKTRRLEAHGDEYKLAPVFEINALRMLMAGKAKEYCDLWEGDRDTTDAAKSYEELLNNAKDYARRRKLENAV